MKAKSASSYARFPLLALFLFTSLLFSNSFSQSNLQPEFQTTAQIKVFLQGAYDVNTGLMRTDLIALDSFPEIQPYSAIPWDYYGTESISSKPANVVDWVLVELRKHSDTIVDIRAGLLLDDGQVVDTNLNSSLMFEHVDAGDYYIIVKHRNHMPIMSRNPVSLPNGTAYDFSDTTNFPPYGNSAQAVIELDTDVFALIAGDINQDCKIQYSGQGNDRGLILQRIVNETGSTNITTIINGFYREDLTMDGHLQYSGPGNDQAKIIQNISLITGGNIITSTFNCQVPPAIVYIPCTPQPTQANAGPDQMNVMADSTFLQANAALSGTGIWAIESGVGGIIDNPSDSNSLFKGIIGNTYTLSWTITNACGSSVDNVIINIAKAQIPNPALIGYWHNWNDVNAPYIQLDAIDNRYNVVEIAFAVPTSPSDMTMIFTPEVVSQSELMSKIQTLQSQKKKVLLSIGGATASIDLTTTANKNAFVNSITAIINTYGFDGIDIDIEHGNSILISGGTIAAPSNIAQVNLIDAIKQIMANYRTTHSQKLLLTMAPETAYVQGGQSAFGGIWGGYLPIIDALRDSLDVLQVQLYNSGSMYGIDQNIYTQGTADFIVAMTEAVIQGFNTSGGLFAGLPASKVAVGLPACTSAAGGGFVDSATVKTAIDYLRGNGSQPGTYVLSNSSGYPSLRGMMTWSINWDAVSSCGSAYEYANNYQSIFGSATSISNFETETAISVYPNPTNGQFTISLSTDIAMITITDILGQQVFKTHMTQNNINLQLDHNGVYIINIATKQGTTMRKLIVNQ